MADRRHNIGEVPVPWGAKSKQDALRGVITSFDLDGRCSYSASHKCHSAAWHWSRCIVIDHPDATVQWEGTMRVPLVDLMRCGRFAVGMHPTCAIDYSEWSGGPGTPRGAVRQARHPQVHRGSLLCCKCFDEHLPYAPDDDPGDTACSGLYETRVGGRPWWVTDIGLPPPPSEPPPTTHSAPPPPQERR